jgi:hypothetical protein
VPPRTFQQVARSQQEINALAVNLAGLSDDPIAMVRIRWGAYNAGSRVLTLQVIDRLEKPYAPRSFKGYRRRANTADGRWVVHWYIADAEFGTPISCAGTYTNGKQFHDLAGFMASECDENGIVKLTITKSGDQTWCHAGVGGLLRSRGIYWLTAPDDDAPPASVGGGTGAGSGGSGSGDIVSSS